VIPDEVAQFLQEGLSIHVATRDAPMAPLGARALALRVHEDGTRLTVFVAEAAVARLRPALEDSRQAAVNVGRPIDDRACQVKGVLEGLRPADAADLQVIEAQWRGFLDQLTLIGVAPDAIASWVTSPAHVIELRVTALFEQTPGPLAGTALPASQP
jgi:hypothetical protein